jgi:multiple sugar transport system permease protein
MKLLKILLKKRDVVKTLGFVFIVFWAFLCVVPVLFMVSTAFKSRGDIWKYPIVWLPIPPQLSNISQVFRYIDLGRMFFNSVYVSSVSTVFHVFITSLSAYAFARIAFKGRGVLFMGFLGTMMIPGFITIIPLYVIMSRFHLLDTYTVLILPNINGAFSIFLFRQFFRSIPFDLDDSARIDGCSKLQILYRIIMPLSQSAIVSVAIFVFMGAWNNLMWPLLVTSNAKLRLLPLGLSYFIVSNSTEYGPLMAAATIASIPLIIVFILAQRRFIEGLTLTGLKV